MYLLFWDKGDEFGYFAGPGTIVIEPNTTPSHTPSIRKQRPSQAELRVLQRLFGLEFGCGMAGGSIGLYQQEIIPEGQSTCLVHGLLSHDMEAGDRPAGGPGKFQEDLYEGLLESIADPYTWQACRVAICP